MATTFTPAKVAAAAGRAYSKRVEAGETLPLLPGPDKKAYAKRLGVAPERIASSFDPVYFDRNGRAFPISAKTTAGLAGAIKKRRDAGGTLARWESIRSAVEEGMGQPISEASVRALYAKRGDIEASYTGRGTRVAAPKTRDDGTAEVEERLEEVAS